MGRHKIVVVDFHGTSLGSHHAQEQWSIFDPTIRDIFNKRGTRTSSLEEIIEGIESEGWELASAVLEVWETNYTGKVGGQVPSGYFVLETGKTTTSRYRLFFRRPWDRPDGRG